LRALFKALGIAPRDALSIKSPSFRALNLDAAKLSDDKIIALMIQEPRLIRRPLIVIDGTLILGFNKDALQSEIERLRE
jgi:arsenate reductase-like glutaredoxin family protein